MWSQSVSIFDPYSAIVDATKKDESANKLDTNGCND